MFYFFRSMANKHGGCFFFVRCRNRLSYKKKKEFHTEIELGFTKFYNFIFKYICKYLYVFHTDIYVLIYTCMNIFDIDTLR